MDLSPEMSSYIKSGRCPHCNAVLLTDDYVRLMGDSLEQAAIRQGQTLNYGYSNIFSVARRIAFRTPDMADEELLAGPERKAKFIKTYGYQATGYNKMQCLTCMQQWYLVTYPFASRRASGTGATVGRPTPGIPQTRGTHTPPGNVTRSINLAGCRMTDVREIKQREEPLSKEKRIYPNNTGNSTVTKEVSISNTISRIVTIESSKVKAHNAQGGITIVGFAEIQGQVQEQLGERYNLITQDAITFSEKTTIEIRPGSTVEHVIQWKVIYETGLAILGQSSDIRYSRLAEVPYRVPMRLTYSEEINNSPPARRRSN
jgi:hypothetical protein